MEVETQVVGENVERKQHTEAQLHSRVTDALIVPDMESGREFGAVVLKTQRLSAVSNDPVEYIHSEYDPQALSALKALYARRDVLRFQLRQLGLRLSAERYHRLVRDNTSGYRVIRVVKGWREVTAYEWSIKHGHWETIQDEEHVTCTEFYERLIKYGNLSPSAKRSAYQSLRQSRLADKIAAKYGIERKKSYVWRTNPRTIRVRNIPGSDGANRLIPKGANLHDYYMAPEPIYGPKKVPIVDWDYIRRYWRLRQELIQPQQEALLQELWDIEDRMIDIRPSSSHKFNRCVQLSGSTYQANSRNVQLLSKEHVGESFPSLPFSPDGSPYGVTGALPGDPNVELVAGRSKVYIAPDPVQSYQEFVDYLSDLSHECEEYSETGVYPVVGDDWQCLENPKCYLGNRVKAHFLITHPVWFTKPDFEPTVPHSLASRLANSAEGDPITLDVDESRPEELDEKISSNLNALLAGRASGSEDITFNMARSMGELKDLPQTGSQSREFLSWLLSRGKDNTLYAFKVKGRKTPIYASLRDYVKSTSTVHGIKVASYKAINRTPSIAMLASAFLGWKFAIQPTIADANRLSRETFSDLVASRRYITRLYRTLSRKTKFIVLRRGFQIGKPVYQDKPVLLGPSDVRSYDTPYRDELRLSRDELIAIMNCDATPFSVATFEADASNASFTVPYVLTRKGLRFYLRFTAGGDWLTADQRRRCAWDSYLRGREVLPVEFYANPFLYRSWLKGCVFARYGRNALVNLAKDRSLAAKLDRLKIVKTAWDLSPLSFLIEWFTNLGDVVQNAQDILSTDSVGIMPIGGPWARVTERFAVSRLSNPQRFHLTQRLISAEYYPILWITGSRGGRRFWAAQAEMAPTRLEWEWAVVDNTTGRPVDHREWVNELQPMLVKTSAAVTNRRPIEWKRELPEFRPRLRLDMGKGLTLLAMYLSGLRR